MTVMVTGGSGFIGSHLVDKLLAKGEDVLIFDFIQPRYWSSIKHFYGSILNLDELERAMKDVDVVYHLAAIADVKDVFEHPHYSERVNTSGTINVLEAARKMEVERVIYGSTDWVYQTTDTLEVDENTPIRTPAHLYSTTKLVSEYYCQNYSDLYGIKYTILRYGIPYGPRARSGAIVPIFVDKAFKGEELTLAGDGSQFRQFIYVEDLAEGNVAALQKAAENKIYNIDGQRPITVKEVAETVQKLVGNVGIRYVPSRPGDFGGKKVSSAKAKKELNWEAKTTFEDGVRKYISWYKQINNIA
nr:NAD-dependent epimerase/dehydratase family protein [uncultured Methanoregula sp.]